MHVPRARDKLWLAILIAGAFAVRWMLMFWLNAHEISTEGITAVRGVDDGWAFGYEAGRIAQSLCQGEGFSSPFPHPSGPTAWLMPLYPSVLACVFTVFGVYTKSAAIATLTLNCFLSAVTVIPVFYLARSVFGTKCGWLSAVAFALYPPSVWHAINTIWDTTLFALLAVTLVWSVTRLNADRRWADYAAAGLFFGFVALCNAVVLAYLAFVAVALFARDARKGRLMLGVRNVCVMILATAALVLPWIARNRLVLGRSVLRSNLGVELRIGNNARALESVRERGRLDPFWVRGHPSVSEDEFACYLALGEPEYDRRCMNDALEFIREQPFGFCQLTGYRVVSFWLLGDPSEWMGNLDIGVSVGSLKRLCHWIPVLFGLIGLFFGWRDRRPIGPLLGLLIMIPLIYYVTHVTNRYRYPIEPVILILGCYGFLQVCGLCLGRRRLKAGLSPGCPAAPTGSRDGNATSRSA